MWKKNLLFLIVSLGVAGSLLGGLVPARPSSRGVDVVPLEPDVRESVARFDAMLTKAWQTHGLTPSPSADGLALARRLSLSLAGTLPSLQEVRLLEGLPEAQRFSYWRERLLADPRAADYLAERLARAYVGNESGPFLLFRRRRFVAWLSEQIAHNRPYDQIVRELIAADGLWTGQPAVNFATAAVRPDERNAADENQLVTRVSRAFLGMRMDCCQCHDYPFDDKPWKQADFRSLAAFFGGTRVTLAGVRDLPMEYRARESSGELSDPIAAAAPFLREALPDDGSPRERLASWVVDPRNATFSQAIVNRMWNLLFGQPLVAPLDDLPLPRGVRAPSPPSFTDPQRWSHELLEAIAADFVAHGHDLRRLIRVLTSTTAWQRDSRAAECEDATTTGEAMPADSVSSSPNTGDAADYWAIFPLTRLRAEQVAGAVMQASVVEAIDHRSHLLLRLAREIGKNDFLKHYGDLGVDELLPQSGTIPQRLILMNGSLVRDRIKENPLLNASTQISFLAADDERAVDAAYLAALTRRPTDDERDHFTAQLRGKSGQSRRRVVEDLFWTLMNSTEFAWNH